MESTELGLHDTVSECMGNTGTHRTTRTSRGSGSGAGELPNLVANIAEQECMQHSARWVLGFGGDTSLVATVAAPTRRGSASKTPTCTHGNYPTARDEASD